MAKVYTGRVAMPGDKIQDYLKMLKEAEKQREPFRNAMDALNEEFHEHLLTKYRPNTARKHSMIVEMWFFDVGRGIAMERVAP